MKHQIRLNAAGSGLCQLCKKLLNTGVLVRCLQVVQVALGNDTTLMDDDDIFTDRFDFLHDMGGEQYGPGLA